MKVTIWGCRGSLPTPITNAEIEKKLLAVIKERNTVGSDVSDEDLLDTMPYHLRGTYGGNTPCVEIEEDGVQIIFDAGSGIRSLGMKMMGGPSGKGQGEINMFFSHTHWDHLMGFPFFVPAYIPGNQITFYSCHDDIEGRLKHQQVYTHFPVSIDQDNPDIAFMPSKKAYVQCEVDKTITVGPFKVTPIKHHHPGDAFGYRVESPKGVFVYATDAEYTEYSWEERQKHVEFFADADLLIFDAQYSLVEAVEKLAWGHSSPFIGVEMANDANVKQLLLFHHDPTTTDEHITVSETKAKKFNEQWKQSEHQCKVDAAREGMVVEIGE